MTQKEKEPINVVDKAILMFGNARVHEDLLVFIGEMLDLAKECSGRLMQAEVIFSEILQAPALKDIYSEVGVPPDRELEVTIEALRQFVAGLSVSGARDAVAFLSCAALAAVTAVAPPPAPVKKAPVLVGRKNLLQSFQPAKFKPAAALGVELLSWQSEYPGGKGLGPQLFAFSLNTGDTVRILTETGELVDVSSETFLLSRAAPEDYTMIPPELLAYARIGAVDMFSRAYSAHDACFGQFTKPVIFAPYGTSFVQSLQALFLEPQAYPDGAGPSVTFNIDGTAYFVTLDARVSSTGPYVTAKLLDSNENVVMRLDTPRQFSPLGVYLFPLQDAVIALSLF